MKCLLTGSSSGIGKDMAIYLSNLGYDLILVARRKEKLEELKKELKTNVEIISLDLSIPGNPEKLYELTKDKDIDMLINNAGFGLFGKTHQTDLSKELEMINLNIVALHVLTKLFLKDFIKKDKGNIINVASSAGFLAGPFLNTYYATKNYALKYTMAIYEELRTMKSNVKVSAICPGPVETEFNKVAKGKFIKKGISSKYVARYSIDQALKGKLIIIPTIFMKLIIFINRFIPTKLLLRVTGKIQERKNNNV